MPSSGILDVYLLDFLLGEDFSDDESVLLDHVPDLSGEGKE